jgi:hypothetical protein
VWKSEGHYQVKISNKSAALENLDDDDDDDDDDNSDDNIKRAWLGKY